MTPLTMDTYARVLAHAACRRGVPLDEILAELGVDAEDLRAAEPLIREQLAGAWVARKGLFAMKFAAALGAELSRLGPIDGARPKALAGEQAPADARQREPELPSFLHVSPPRGPVGHIFLSDPSPQPITPSDDKRPPVNEAPPSMTGTMLVDYRDVVAAIEQASLPFAPSEPSTPPASTDTSENIDFALLPIETYASVSGALARGESREAALARHRVSPEVFDRLAKAWAKRFQAEPYLLVKFKEMARTNATRGRRME